MHRAEGPDRAVRQQCGRRTTQSDRIGHRLRIQIRHFRGASKEGLIAGAYRRRIEQSPERRFEADLDVGDWRPRRSSESITYWGKSDATSERRAAAGRLRGIPARRSCGAAEQVLRRRSSLPRCGPEFNLRRLPGHRRGVRVLWPPVRAFGGTLRLELHDVVANDQHGVALFTVSAEREGRPFAGNEVLIGHLSPDGKATEVWTQPVD